MGSRIELHKKLCDLLGSTNVYYQPPENFKMKYPAIVYGLSDIDTVRANNDLYLTHRRYTVTSIDKNPENITVEKLLRFPNSSYDRHYNKDQLNHDIFTIYY